MEAHKYITLGPKLHQMFQEKKPSDEIKKFYQENNSISPLSRKEDDLQMLWCYAAYYDHFQYIKDQEESYNPHSKYQPLITAVRRKDNQMVRKLLNRCDPDQQGYGIFNHRQLYVRQKTSALTEALKADDTVLFEILSDRCSGEIHGLLAMAEKHKAENCIEYINDRVEQITRLRNPRGENPPVYHMHMEGLCFNYLDMVIYVSQLRNGMVTELQQQSAWYLWSIAVKYFPVPNEHKNMFLCPHNREQIRQLLSDKSKRKKFLKLQIETPVIHASFPAQHADDSYNSLHARVILDCLNRYLYNLKTPVQSMSFTLIIGLMVGFFSCGQSATVKGSLKFMNMILYLLVKHQFVPNADDQDDRWNYAIELFQNVNAALISEYLKNQAKTFMSMMAMSGYAKQMTLE